MADARYLRKSQTLAARPVKGFVAGPRAVGSFVPKLAQKAFERYGFAAAAVLTDWSSIVGSDLARCTLPERLRWPRQAQDRNEDAGTDRSRASSRSSNLSGRTGATLILRVEPANALEIQYKAAQVVERINAYFGYQAVTDLRLIQGPVASPRKNRLPMRTAAQNAQKVVAGTMPRSVAIVPEGIVDGELRQALEKLGSSIGAAARNAS